MSSRAPLIDLDRYAADQWRQEGRARTQLGEYLDYLTDRAPALAHEAASELRSAADQVIDRPGLARRSRWDGLFERSARRWKKLLVLDVSNGAVRVVSFYDQRQDLSTVNPLSK